MFCDLLWHLLLCCLLLPHSDRSIVSGHSNHIRQQNIQNTRKWFFDWRTSESSAPFLLFFPLVKGSGIGRSLMVKVQPPPASFSASPDLSSLRFVLASTFRFISALPSVWPSAALPSLLPSTFSTALSVSLSGLPSRFTEGLSFLSSSSASLMSSSSKSLLGAHSSDRRKRRCFSEKIDRLSRMSPATCANHRSYQRSPQTNALTVSKVNPASRFVLFLVASGCFWCASSHRTYDSRPELGSMQLAAVEVCKNMMNTAASKGIANRCQLEAMAGPSSLIATAAAICHLWLYIAVSFCWS